MPTSLGPAEILVILIVALIVLGPKKLPEAGRQVGKAIAEVRKWSQGFQDEIRTAIDPDASAPTYPPMQSNNPAYPAAEPAPTREATPADTVPDGTGTAASWYEPPRPADSGPAAIWPGAVAGDPPEPPAGEAPHL